MRNAILCFAAAIVAGCSLDNPPTSPPQAAVSVSGRVERASTVPVMLTVGGAAVAGAVFTVTPAAAAIVLPGDSLQLLLAGPLTIDARGLSNGDSVHASLPLTVAEPPTIVFDAIVSGNRDIYSVELDGGVLTRITADASDEREPTARGGTVLFVSFRTGTAELFSVPIAGGTETQLTNNSTAEMDDRLSNDGAHLAFAQGSGFPRIMTAGADASSPARLVAADGGFSGAIEASPAWSPDGTRIAYTTTRDGSAGIYVAALSGASGSATQLVSGALGYASVEPTWSADGLSIAFASNRDGPTDLYLVTISSGAVRRLTTRGNVGQPVFLADGRLVFTQYAGGTFGLRWLDPADTSRVFSIPTGPGSAQHPSAVR